MNKKYLADEYPHLEAQWHPTKNATLSVTPESVSPYSNLRVWWRCQVNPEHDWKAAVITRTRINKDGGCPVCGGRVATPATSLAAHHPELATEWHPTLNCDLTPEAVLPRSGRLAHWQCSTDPSHTWQATIGNRVQGTGCPDCHTEGWWTIEAIRSFIASIVEHLASLTPAERYLLFQQAGVLDGQGKGKEFVEALAAGRFPLAEARKFVGNERSFADAMFANPRVSYDELQARTRGGGRGDGADDDLHAESDGSKPDASLPLIQTRDALAALDHVVPADDAEAAEFLLASAVAKMRAHAFVDEKAAVAQAEEYSGTAYGEQARTRFLDEYRAAKSLELPPGYNFSVDGELILPNLMQRFVALRVREQRRVGNWSGTGAGKTAGAVLASRVVNSRLTVVCCPNSTIDGWVGTIGNMFADSVVATKTFTPDWEAEVAASCAPNSSMDDRHQYLVVNYEMFQQPHVEEQLSALVEGEQIGMVVVDEIHLAKNRDPETVSLRRKRITSLVARAAERDPALCVLGMSATPVLNNLQEGKSLLEVVTGLEHNDLRTRPTIPNCMRLYQQMTTIGLRWVPRYNLFLDEVPVPVDCGQFIEQIRALGRTGNVLALEQILTEARLPAIRAHVRPKTLLYTHYVSLIGGRLRQALEEDGWRVGFYTGEDKAGLDKFLHGDLDVLIGSRPVAVGVDGLQRVCDRVVVNVLPWTAAEFDQLKGRVLRQGQKQPGVSLILPLTFAEVAGERWSWCEARLRQLQFKRTIADAAVDGVIPEDKLRNPQQACRDLTSWLERLERGEMTSVRRAKADVSPVAENGAEGGERS